MKRKTVEITVQAKSGVDGAVIFTGMVTKKKDRDNLLREAGKAILESGRSGRIRRVMTISDEYGVEVYGPVTYSCDGRSIRQESKELWGKW